MEIAFILPLEGRHPVGGYKVVYEYANGLARRGHQVHVVHVAKLMPGNMPIRSWWRWYGIFRYIPYWIRGDWRPTGWFKLHPDVKLHWIPVLAEAFLPKVDAYVATWWLTADRINTMKGLAGKRFYLIQHVETWGGAEEEVMATWKGDLEKIVIARWLGDIATEMGETSHYIPNGLDFSKFGCDVPPEDRNPKQLGMLLHNVEWKGSADGVAALEILKKQYPDLQAELFGFFEQPKTLPAWITYHRLPAQDELRRIYNRAAIFLAPSHIEGWDLPASEAMTCGAAVVATEIGGHREFCVDGETALQAPAKNPELMAKAAARMIEDQQLRLRIARNGSANIRKFTWDAAVEAFEEVLQSTLKRTAERQS